LLLLLLYTKKKILKLSNKINQALKMEWFAALGAKKDDFFMCPDNQVMKWVKLMFESFF